MRFQTPDRGAGVIGRAAFAEAFDQFQPRGAFLGIEQSLREGAFDVAEKLAAGRGLLVDEGHVEAAGAGGAGGGQAGGTGPDDDEVHVSVHYSASVGRACRLMSMPSRTGTRQDWTLGSPSISIRHSKQTPMRQ